MYYCESIVKKLKSIRLRKLDFSVGEYRGLLKMNT